MTTRRMNDGGGYASDIHQILETLSPAQQKHLLSGIRNGKFKGDPFELDLAQTPEENTPEPMTVDLHQWFKHVKVVTLDKFPERWEAFEKRAEEAGVTGYERFSAIEGDKVAPSDWFRGGNGAWGCLMSHFRIAQDALMDDEPGHLLALEDDVLFAHNFIERIHAIMEEVGDDWDMLYFGGQHLHQPRLKPYKTPEDHEVIHARNINRTHAFAVNKRFLTKYQQHIIYAPDYIEAEGAWHIDHMLGSLHERQRQHKILCAQPWICGQAAGKSWTSGRKTSEMWWLIDDKDVASRGAR